MSKVCVRVSERKREEGGRERGREGERERASGISGATVVLGNVVVIHKP